MVKTATEYLHNAEHVLRIPRDDPRQKDVDISVALVWIAKALEEINEEERKPKVEAAWPHT